MFKRIAVVVGAILCSAACGELGRAFTASPAGQSAADGNTAAAAGTAEGQDPNIASAGGNATAGVAGDPNQGMDSNTASPARVASACDGSGLRLCDDFESDTFGGSPNSLIWNVEKSTSSFAPEPVSTTLRPAGSANEIIEISSAQAKRGKQSLHFHALNTGLEHVVVSNTSFFPVPNNTFWGRVFMYFPSSSPLPTHHVALVETDGPANGLASQGGNLLYTRFGMDFGGEVQFNWLGDDANVHGSTLLPHNTWTCFEFEFKGDTDELHAWMNEQALPALDVQNHQPAWTAPTYARLQLGWEIYQHDPTNAVAWDIYYDGVAFDTQRIGCTK